MSGFVRWIIFHLFKRRKPKVENLPDSPEIMSDAVLPMVLWELHNQQRN